MYLLTEWEGWTGKYLPQGRDAWIERSVVHTSWPGAKYSSILSNQTRSISILSYDHLVLKVLQILFELK